MLQSDWLSYSNTTSNFSAVAGGRLGNGDVFFALTKFSRNILMHMDNVLIEKTKGKTLTVS